MPDLDQLSDVRTKAYWDNVLSNAHAQCQIMRRAQLAGIAIALLAPGWWKLGGIFVYWMWGTPKTTWGPSKSKFDYCKQIPVWEAEAAYWQGKL